MKMMKKFCLCIILCVMLPLNAAGYDNLVTFGDSLTDSGNILAASPDSYNSLYYLNGRFSNGLVWADYLSERLGFDTTLLLAQILAGLAMPDTNNVWYNNAFGGAETGALEIPPGFITQVGAWVTAGIEVPENSLCIVWIGSNDFLNWVEGHTVSEGATDTIATSVSNIIYGLTLLVDSLQATDIMVINLPDIGKTPANNGVYAGTYGEDKSDLGTEISTAFNSALKESLDSFAATYPDINLIQQDIFTVMNKMIENPEHYGLLNSTHGARFETAQGDGFNNSGKYLFWDVIHPTTEAHEIAANQIYGTLFINSADDNVVFFETSNDNEDIIGIAYSQGNVFFESYTKGSDNDTTSNTDKPDDFIYGVCEFSLNIDENERAEIKIYLPEAAPSDAKWYKSTSDGWIDFNQAFLDDSNGDGAVFNADRTEVILYITDNGNYDDDSTVGMIKDPSGLAIKDSDLSEPVSDVGDSSDSDICFIGALSTETANTRFTPLSIACLFLLSVLFISKRSKAENR